MNGESIEDRDIVEVLADEYISRRRLGESPAIEEYAERCPERADEIRSLFPAIAMMEAGKPQRSPRVPVTGLSYPSLGRLGDCRLIREIGRGGMGIVYEAEQESLSRRVAVKVLPHAPWADDRPMRRFLREAKTTANLRHGNIVPVFAIGQEGDLHYYVMPLIVGVGLDRVIYELRRRSSNHRPPAINEAGRLAQTLWDGSFVGDSPPTRADGDLAPSNSKGVNLDGHPPQLAPRDPRYWSCIAKIGQQAAEALSYAHEQGVLHRDIKPANLLLDKEGRVWVADFGLAKSLLDDDLSRTGDFVGTPRYMPPERFHGRSDARGDIYGLGLILYEFLALRPAFESADRGDAIRAMANPRPPRPQDLDASIPLDLEIVVLKAINPDPDHRYSTALEFADDLGRFAEGRPILARRETGRQRLSRWTKQNPTNALLAATSILLGLIAAFFFGLFLFAPPRHPGDRQPPRRPGDRLPPPRPGDRLPPPIRQGFPPRGFFPPPRQSMSNQETSGSRSDLARH